MHIHVEKRLVVIALALLFVGSLLAIDTEATLSRQITIATSGQIASGIENKRPTIGWGGYFTRDQDVVPILDDLAAGNYAAIRYWARPYWLYGASSNNLDLTRLDLLVNEAAKRNIVVYVDCEHNYPPSAYVNSTNKETWIDEVIAVGLRLNNRTNVVLEPVNEYTGSDQVQLYNWAINRLRNESISLPLLWNFWWNQPNAALADPADNYAIGRHLYGHAFDNYTRSTPTSLADTVADSGVGNSMHTYFDDKNNRFYFQEVVRLEIPNGWVISELGPTDNEQLVGNPSVGNMAYAMQFLREAAARNVSVMCYRIGTSSKKALYEQRALEYFGENYAPQP